MTSRRDRAFAWVGVIVAVISALALSSAVVIQQILDNRAAKQAPATTTAQTCTTDNTSTEVALPVPTVYKPSGTVTKLATTDLTVGTGATAASGQCLVVKYYGTLATTGKEFDENFSSTTGFAFPLGQGQVIPGWDQGLVGMKVGGTRRLVIPASLAYGSASPSSAVPANSSLVFVVKLLRIQN